MGHHEVLGQADGLGSLARALTAEHDETDAVGHRRYFDELLADFVLVVSRKPS